jgi:ABC-type transport system involved in multi-copper enzyme maturation permease subunit
VTIVKATLREMLGRKVLLWGVLLSLAFLGLYVTGLALIRREMSGTDFDQAIGSLLAILALYIVSFLGSFLGLVLSAGSVATEVDAGLIHAVVARPLRRSRWLAERWAAIAGVVAVYTVVMGAAMMYLAEAVLVYNPGSAGRALALMALQAVTMVTLGVFLSTRLSAIATGVTLFALFGLAWLAGVIEYIGQNIGNEAMVNSGIVTSLIMPTDALWKAASYYGSSPELLGEFVAQTGLPFSSVTPPTASFVAWSLGYLVVIGWLGLRRFARRDL